MSSHRARTILRSMVLVAATATLVASVAIIATRGWTDFVHHNAPLAIVWLGTVGLITWLASGKSRSMLVWILAIGVVANGFYLVGEAIRLVLDPDGPLNIAVNTAVPADMPRTAAVAVAITQAIASSGTGLFNVFALLLFPNGRLPSRRWRPIAAIVVAVAVWTFVVNLIVWNPSSTVVPDEHPVWGYAGSFTLVGFPLAFLSLVTRYRTSSLTERAQIKLVLWGAAIFLPSILLGSIAGAPVLIVGGSVVLLATYGIAIIRHNLFDVNMVISRTLAYSTLAALIGAVYIGVVVGVGSLLGSGDEPNPVLAIAATALVAVAFQPARLRLQGLANRLVFGRRSTPYEVLSDFSRRVAATSDSLLAAAAHSLVEGTAAERVVVTIDLGNETTQAAAWPVDDADPAHATEVLRLPIVEGGVQLGSLDVFTAPGNTLLDDDRRLAEHLAAGMGLALTNQALTERLASRIDELRGSRRRLVAVQDDTRRRLERDLHDGAQQQLVALKVKLGLCRSLVDVSRHAELADKLDRLSHDADRSVEAMRDFARGVYPPLLESEGLGAAIGAQARRSGRPVEVDADGIGRYPREVESSVYFCVLEALDAVGDDAPPTGARIQVSQNNGSLRFEVHNDGGIDDRLGTRSDAQTALRRIGDRLDALSGTFDFVHSPDQGTTLSGVVPVEVVPS